MRRVKSILYGATALMMIAAAGNATAQISTMEDSSASASAIYPIDEDRDGRVDRLLILEQSDSLA
jgi:hypothetical protein